MKKLLLICLFISCCTHSYAGYVKLHGVIIHPLSDTVKITYAFISIDYQPRNYSAVVDKNGSFSFVFRVADDFTEITITNGEQQTEIYVQPGADLTLTIDGDHFDSSVHYEGKGKEIANFDAALIVAGLDRVNLQQKVQAAYSSTPNEFYTYCQKVQKEEIDFLSAFGHKLPEAYKVFYKTECRFRFYNFLQVYPHFHEYTMGNDDTANTHIQDYAVIDKIPREFNDKYLTSFSYRYYISEYFYLKIMSQQAHDRTSPLPRDVLLDSAECMAYHQLPPQSAAYSIAQDIFYNVQNAPLDEIERKLKTYKARFPHSKYIPVLEDAMMRKRGIAPGKQEIDFTIISDSGTKLRLSDLKGNVVYIDFWSRGCGPCIAELSYAKKVRAHFTNSPVVFLYISLDDDLTWRTAIKQLGISGLNMHVVNNFESEIVKEYGVKGIPAYFLIDKTGKFAAVNQVARPSDTDKLIAQIAKLLD